MADYPPGLPDSGTPSDSPDRADRLLRAVTAAHPAGENRPPQREMTRLVAEAADSRTALIVQAGTGTGKSLAYLCGAFGARARFVVSTATKQLSDQLVEDDLPEVLAAVRSADRQTRLGTVLKGRANYVCLAKVDEIRSLDRRAPGGAGGSQVVEQLDLGLPADSPSADEGAVSGHAGSGPRRPSAAEARAMRDLLDWVASAPESGDRGRGPAVPDSAWVQVSTTSAECPGAQACPFGGDCFAEAARTRARAADAVVVNHALLAQDFVSPSPLFDDRDLIIVDEVHELERYLSNAWGHELTAETIERAVAAAARRVPQGEDDAARAARAVGADAAAVITALAELAPGRIVGGLPTVIEGPLASLDGHARSLADHLDRLGVKAEGEPALGMAAARGQLMELVEGVEAVRSDDVSTVRWVEARADGGPARLKAAPLAVGPRFRRALGERALVATSATASVGGDFRPVAAMLGLEPTGTQEDDGSGAGREWHGVDVGSPFDYPRQGILYVPRNLPAPVGRERVEHSAAVLDELTDLVRAAGGRALALFTTTAGARSAAERMRLEFPGLAVLEHGELPAADLADEFAADETSVLCVTMGMWSGLNIIGPACSLVVIDKIPFPPMDDPLSAARREDVDAAGGDGFSDVFVARAALMLTQGAGRLIRSRDDRGMVAILDPRLHTKRYGAALLRSLPQMWRTDDPRVARAALGRLAGGG